MFHLCLPFFTNIRSEQVSPLIMKTNVIILFIVDCWMCCSTDMKTVECNLHLRHLRSHVYMWVLHDTDKLDLANHMVKIRLISIMMQCFRHGFPFAILFCKYAYENLNEGITFQLLMAFNLNLATILCNIIIQNSIDLLVLIPMCTEKEEHKICST